MSLCMTTQHEWPSKTWRPFRREGAHPNPMRAISDSCQMSLSMTTSDRMLVSVTIAASTDHIITPCSRFQDTADWPLCTLQFLCRQTLSAMSGNCAISNSIVICLLQAAQIEVLTLAGGCSGCLVTPGCKNPCQNAMVSRCFHILAQSCTAYASMSPATMPVCVILCVSPNPFQPRSLKQVSLSMSVMLD